MVQKTGVDVVVGRKMDIRYDLSQIIVSSKEALNHLMDLAESF